MPVSFFSMQNFQKILNFASQDHVIPGYHGFTYWLQWWLLKDKNRKSCSTRSNNFQFLEKDLLLWWKYGLVIHRVNFLFSLNSTGKIVNSQRYHQILENMLSWFRTIDRLEIECPPDLEQDLIKLLGLSLALLNFFTSNPKENGLRLFDEPEDDADLTEVHKIRILQGCYYWLVLKHGRSLQALAILKNCTATLKPTQAKKTGWFEKKARFECVESTPSLEDRLECTLASKSEACYAFLDYFLAYYDPGKGLRGKREVDFQAGTDFLIPAVDFMRKYQDELEDLDDDYTHHASERPAYRARLLPSH